MKCYNCQRLGNFVKYCKSIKNIKKAGEKLEINKYINKIKVKTYSANLFRITTQHVLKKHNNGDFEVEVVATDTAIADTGANISFNS